MTGFNRNSLAEVHPGLLLNKLGLHRMFMEDRRHNLKILPRSTKRHQEYDGDREIVFEAAVSASKNSGLKSLYAEFYAEWLARFKAMTEAGEAKLLRARLKSRLVTGLSAAAAMQTGMVFHHTYGVPFLPGSSVKGACRAAAEPVDEAVYGTERKKGDNRPASDHHGGGVIFLDALPCAPPVLEIDVMTPHHTKYYEGKPEFTKAPDVEDPVPVFFMATPKGTEFLFAFVSKDGDLLEQVEKDWRDACEEGFGAKVSSGYGWFEPLD